MAEAENYIKAYFEHFPKVKAWLDNTRVLAANRAMWRPCWAGGTTLTCWKTGTNYAMRQRGGAGSHQRAYQGTAADIIKLAMIALPDAFAEAGLNRLHAAANFDELIFEVPEEEVAETVTIAKGVMEHTMLLDVPLLTEARTGNAWGELEPVGDSVIEDLTDAGQQFRFAEMPAGRLRMVLSFP